MNLELKVTLPEQAQPGSQQPGSRKALRRFPIGAEIHPGKQGVHFRVWAPDSAHAAVELARLDARDFQEAQVFAMEPEANGYFAVEIREASAGQLYKIKLNSGSYPDPASRFQPSGPHGPSEIIDPSTFRWTDGQWRGVPPEGQVIYEMHVGTFTPEGTFAAALEQLPELARIGITVIEIMPVADFPGRFGWGYDGVNMFAPTRLYGRPDDFRTFVDRAHALGLGVILDVVYNHFGPDGNFFGQFSKDYFSRRYKNEWGEPLNFDGENSGPVREFFLTNARYWVEEFHLDGLRLDATQQIFDSSSQHILSDLARQTREAVSHRKLYFVGENEPQETRLLRSRDQGGCDLDALWNDDFHHSAMVALTGRNEAYYTDYRGRPQEFISSVKRGFLYQGQWYSWQRNPRGTSARGLAPTRFVIFLQNHDQVANSLHGFRIHQLTSPGQLRAMTALLLLAPATPMLFQGQEFAASAPFLYFADHHPELASLVAKGRAEFLSQFASIAALRPPYTANPADERTFRQCKLDFSERKSNEAVYQLHIDLLRLRREDPVFSASCRGEIDGAVLSEEAFVLRLFTTDDQDRLLLINLGRDLSLRSMPEPLLAPPEDGTWALLWSSEDPRYGGGGTPPIVLDDKWVLAGHAALVLGSEMESKHS